MNRSRSVRGAVLVLAAAGVALLAAPSRGSERSGPAVNGQTADETRGTPSEFPGMAAIPGGEFEMGVDENWLEKRYKPGSNQRKWHLKLIGPDKDFLWWCLLTETPEHEVTTPPYAIDRYCVTNRQYETFLEKTSRTTIFIGGNIRSILDIGKKLRGEEVSEKALATIYWLNVEKLDQLAARVCEKNSGGVKAALDAFNAGRPPNALVKSFDDLPEKERVAAWIGFILPENTAIDAYSRRVPRHWPKGRVTPEIEALPVVNVTAKDADDFAEWAGKHVPTEAEWEKAARGPKGWMWPFGKDWDADKERNLLVWLGTDPEPKGPAPGTKDHPIAVNRLPDGQSGYGVFQMLGNVYQWTSSTPVLYPESEAEPASWFGRPGYRVLRGASYGQGMVAKDKSVELVIRNTTRILAVGPNRPVVEAIADKTIGFRCAKYPTPAQDVMMHHLDRLQNAGSALPKDDPDQGLVFDARRAYGVERNSYAPSGSEGKGLVFVTGETRAVGFLPLEKLPYSTAKHLLAAQADRKEDDPPVLLGLLYWNADLSLDLFERVERKAEIPPPGDGSPVDPSAGEGDPKAGGEEGTGDGAKEGAGEEGAGKDGGDEGGAEGNGDGAGSGDEGGDGEAPADPAAPEGPGTPPGPPKVEEHRRFVPPDRDGAIFLGIDGDRIALFRKQILGYRLLGWLPEAEGIPPIAERLKKGSPKEIHRGARIDPATGVVTLDLAIPTGSQMSKDVYGLTIRLTVKGKLSGNWRETTE